MNIQDDNDSRLRRQLCREARQSRPTFSRALHARLRSAISAAEVHRSQAVVIRSRPSQRRPFLSWTVTGAALVIVLALALFWNNPRLPRDQAIVQPADSSIRLGVRGKTADDSQWAGLNHDAQTALAAVAGPLPFDLKLSVAQGNGP